VEPNVGVKFYSIMDRSSFSIWYVEDDSLRDVTFSRFTYSPFTGMNLGVFLNINRIGYNVFSSDFSYYLKNIKTNFSFQYSRRFDLLSELFEAEVNKEVVRGFGYYILYREVDSSFISPLNYVNLYFDGVRKFYVSFNYKGFYKERFYVVFRPYFITLNIKYNDFLMHQDFGFNGVLGFVPYFLLIDYKSSILGYLSDAVNLEIIDDIRLNTVSLGFLYQVSA